MIPTLQSLIDRKVLLEDAGTESHGSQRDATPAEWSLKPTGTPKSRASIGMFRRFTSSDGQG